MWISFGVGPAVIDYCFMLESYGDLFRVFLGGILWLCDVLGRPS